MEVVGRGEERDSWPTRGGGAWDRWGLGGWYLFPSDAKKVKQFRDLQEDPAPGSHLRVAINQVYHFTWLHIRACMWGDARGRVHTARYKSLIQDVSVEVSRTLSLPSWPAPHSRVGPSSEFSPPPNEVPISSSSKFPGSTFICSFPWGLLPAGPVRASSCTQ